MVLTIRESNCDRIAVIDKSTECFENTEREASLGLGLDKEHLAPHRKLYLN